MSRDSYRTIMRSSSILGGAQAINVVVSIVKAKAVAVILGPTGVGVLGVYMDLVQTGAKLAALGTETSGTRQIAAAQAKGGDEAVRDAWQALRRGTMVLALVGGMVFWLTRSWLAALVVGDELRARELGWMALAVTLTVGAGAQAALLTGLRRVGDLARINVISGVTGAAIGLSGIKIWGEGGMLMLVLAGPAATWVAGHIYVSQLKIVKNHRAPIGGVIKEWVAMVRLGTTLMISGIVVVLGVLAVRALVTRDLGSRAQGHFQAAWSIGMTYLGFILGAMAKDYYPRLTAIIKDKASARKLVNEQTEVALLLFAPVVLLLVGCAPYVLRLLYSAEFDSATDVLRWQLLGDLLKLMLWPLSFVVLARGDGKTFLILEVVGSGAFAFGVWVGTPLIGLEATGLAFILKQVLTLPAVYWLARRHLNFSWTGAVKVQSLMVMAAAVLVVTVGRCSDVSGAAVGVPIGILFACRARTKVAERTGMDKVGVRNFLRVAVKALRR